MSMTVTEAVAQTRDIMNATGSGQWTDPILTTWVGVAHWREYANLLSANRFYRMQQVQLTQDSNGQIPFASLNTGSGNSAKFWYRVIAVSQVGVPSGQSPFYYRQATFDQFPSPQPMTAMPYVWYRFGDQMQVIPVAPGQALTITTNFRPPRADTLSPASTAIDFPSGYENLIPWRAAWLALTKGGSEVQAAQDINAVADQMANTMLEDLGRESTWPTIARAFDDPEMWGG